MIKIRSAVVLLYFYVKWMICKYRKIGKIIGKQINYEKRLKLLLSNEEYCTQIRYGMSLFSMRNLKIRVIYHGEMEKIGKLKLSSAVEPSHWAFRRRCLVEPSSTLIFRTEHGF